MQIITNRWKNNSERKKKNAALHFDAQYIGQDRRLIARARFCQNVIAIAINVKNYCEKSIQRNGGLIQVLIPFPMPSHMPTPGTVPKNCIISNIFFTCVYTVFHISVDNSSYGTGVYPSPRSYYEELTGCPDCRLFSRLSDTVHH